MPKKILFLDRDGTLIDEPLDQQVDSLQKVSLTPHVIPALLQLQAAGYIFVMISNQDGLGTASFEKTRFDQVQNFVLQLFNTQGIRFENIRICPHFADDHCQCRKPNVGLVLDYMRDGFMDFKRSFVIGDRQTDIELAENMGIAGILYDDHNNWLDIARKLTTLPRTAQVKRVTAETDVRITVELDNKNEIQVATGLRFFDHMVEQLAKHAGFGLMLQVKGDLDVDEHHTVEDVALAMGEALRQALGDKLGINRYGFLLPMDEARAEIAIDLSGRSYFVFEGNFTREKVGELPTELVPHFFRSLSDSLRAAIHIKVQGDNDHHRVESIFKGVGRALRQAIYKQGHDMPSTKGIL